MGVTAVKWSSATGGAGAGESLVQAVGSGPGAAFVAMALVVLLAAFNLLSDTPRDHEYVRTMLIASIVPLGATFGLILLVESLQAL